MCLTPGIAAAEFVLREAYLVYRRKIKEGDYPHRTLFRPDPDKSGHRDYGGQAKRCRTKEQNFGAGQAQEAAAEGGEN